MNRYCVRDDLDHGLVVKVYSLRLVVLFAQRSHERRVLNEMSHTLGQIEDDSSNNRDQDIPVAEDHVLCNLGGKKFPLYPLARSASTAAGP